MELDYESLKCPEIRRHILEAKSFKSGLVSLRKSILKCIEVYQMKDVDDLDALEKLKFFRTQVQKIDKYLTFVNDGVESLRNVYLCELKKMTRWQFLVEKIKFHCSILIH